MKEISRPFFFVFLERKGGEEGGKDKKEEGEKCVYVRVRIFCKNLKIEKKE